MKTKRNIIEIDEEKCNGCGQCVLACAEGAIQLVNGKARLVSENYCDGLAACLGECPEGALKIVERDADAFDSEAVEQYLKKQGSGVGEQRAGNRGQKTEDRSQGSGVRVQGSENPQSAIPTCAASVLADRRNPQLETLSCGCPSTHLQMFASPCEAANRPVQRADVDSALTHWPVQIKLVPPAAPFLKGADLLIASDCTPVAYSGFHNDFLKGKTVLMGCPKFDDTEEYINKFAEIFRIADIKSITALIMEVPCCSKMPFLIQQGMEGVGVSRSKPSRGEEAWSFAYAKVPKPNASD
ncbi:MAG: 4Fe-4S binding protein [Proteobacteria bacterium]|nr:4Fe-4S binding protein [Pseudomonadota bacterium]